MLSHRPTHVWSNDVRQESSHRSENQKRNRKSASEQMLYGWGGWRVFWVSARTFFPFDFKFLQRADRLWTSANPTRAEHGHTTCCVAARVWQRQRCTANKTGRSTWTAHQWPRVRQPSRGPDFWIFWISSIWVPHKYNSCVTPHRVKNTKPGNGSRRLR